METEKIRSGTDVLPNDRSYVDVSLVQSMIGTLQRAMEGEIRRLDQIGDLRDKGVSIALVAAEKAVAAALQAADKATDKAERTTADSFSKVNEFRGALDDLGKTMSTRREMEDMKKALELMVDGTRGQLNANLSKIEVAIDANRAAISALSSRLDKSPEVRDLTRRADVDQGTNAGAQATKDSTRLILGTMVSLVVLALAIATFLIRMNS